MKKILALTLMFAFMIVGSSQTQQAPQAFVGRISDSMCGASHKALAGNLTDRQCLFECLKRLAKWVLVDDSGRVFAIANQDLPGLPLYAGRPVRLMGELKGDSIVATRVEAYPPHLHIGHVMTNWRDTPGGVGFLIIALSDARVAAVHAKLVAGDVKDLDAMKLHAGHVLHALDSSVEPKGPASGYGVKKAAAGAQQHLDFAAKAEGATANVKGLATQVTASLGDAVRWTDESIALAQKIRAATTAAEAAPMASELSSLTARIVDDGLAKAQSQMTEMMKGEGIENAPR